MVGLDDFAALVDDCGRAVGHRGMAVAESVARALLVGGMCGGDSGGDLICNL